MNWSITLLAPWWLAALALTPLVAWLSHASLSGLRGSRRWTVVALRSLALILVVLALADVQLVQESQQHCAMFALDQSFSVPSNRSEAALAGISHAISARPDLRDQVGLVAFGKEARLELPPAEYGRERRVLGVGAKVDRQHSDLAAGIKLALGSFPPDVTRRIVLLSDGNQNRGDVMTQALAARDAHIPIDVVPLDYRYESEILIDKIVLPPELKKGDTANLKIVVRAAAPASGTLRVLQTANEQSKTIVEQQVALRQGLNVFSRSITIEEPNFYAYEAQFEPNAAAGDVLARNNTASSFSLVRGEGRILFIRQPNDNWSALLQILRRDNLFVQDSTPDQAPDNLSALRQYDAVIVANVPSEMVPERLQVALAANTRELGAGLLMLGGPDSFGAGGYNGSILEKALPVDMDIKSVRLRGKGALVLIMHACEIAEGNFWQKAIAKLALKTLASTDECGLVYWGGTTSWLFPLQLVGNRQMMEARIDRMSPGDMPDFDSSMKLSINALIKSDASVKHVIIISDGDPQPPSSAVIARFQQAKVTCTAVAVAAHGGIERRVMRQIAQQTKGRFYEVNNPNTLPEIYIKETRVVSRPLVFEQAQSWSPSLRLPTDPVAGLAPPLPAIRGYVLTTAKPTADVPITSAIPANATEFPLLAHWQYGLGRAVAFTTDAGQRWAVGWPGSPASAKFWSQLVRWSLRTSESDTLSVSTEEKEGRVTVVVNALDKGSEFLNFLRLRGKVVQPDLTAVDLDFKQTEPGKYQASFDANQSGSYLLRMGYRLANGQEGSASSAVNISYPAEYRDIESHRDLLETVASVSGGRVIELDQMDREDFFLKDQAPTRRLQDAWPWALWLGLMFFFLDIATRRIAIEGKDVAQAARRAWSRLRRRPLPTTPATIDRLRGRKVEMGEAFDRHRDARAVHSDPPTMPRTPSPTIPTKPVLERESPASINQPPKIAPTPPEDPPSAGSYTDRLKKAKRDVWKDRENPDSRG